MQVRRNIFTMVKFQDLPINMTFYTKIGRFVGWWIKVDKKNAKLIHSKPFFIDIPLNFLVLIEKSTNEKL